VSFTTGLIARRPESAASTGLCILNSSRGQRTHAIRRARNTASVRAWRYSEPRRQGRRCPRAGNSPMTSYRRSATIMLLPDLSSREYSSQFESGDTDNSVVTFSGRKLRRISSRDCGARGDANRGMPILRRSRCGPPAASTFHPYGRSALKAVRRSCTVCKF
jgi:hypothetical protein